MSSSLPDILNELLEHRSLSSAQMEQLIQSAVTGECGDVELAALLTALRMKGETAEELAAGAGVLRRHMVRLDSGRDDILDTCGMGGDGVGTFNISTATAIVAAGTGVPVVKHGNRAVSSSSGSADVLGVLGVKMVGDTVSVVRCLHRAGLTFCFAPLFHPAMAKVAAVRKRLKVRTTFNLLGPLANPASAAYQLMGVARPELLDPLAGALAHLGIRRAILVCGADGLDEVSLSTETHVREVRNGTITRSTWNPGDFGLPGCSVNQLRVDTPEQSAAVIRDILAGKDGPPRWIVLANCAAALLTAERVTTLREGVEKAAQALDSGAASGVLHRLVEASQMKDEK